MMAFSRRISREKTQRNAKREEFRDIYFNDPIRGWNLTKFVG